LSIIATQKYKMYKLEATDKTTDIKKALDATLTQFMIMTVM